MDVTYFGPLPPHPGGIAQHGDALIDGFLRRGHRVQRLSWRDLYPPRLYPGSVASKDRNPRSDALELADWHDPRTWVRAGWRARAGDAIVLPWVTPFHAPAVLTTLSACAEVARLILVHNALPHERHRGDTLAIRAALRQADGAVVHATSVADDLSWLLPRLQVAVVPHPPNLPLSATPLPAPTPLRVLVFGYVRAYKGVESALDALGLLTSQGSDVRLTIAGEFWEPVDEWVKEIAARGLGERVSLRPGYVADEDVQELFDAHHVLLAPYRSATQSGTIPLARAAGRAVVATDVGGLREAIDDGADGLLVPAGSAERIAVALQETQARLQDLAAASASRTSRWEDVADAFTALAGR